jgi:alkylated DNA repair dioxygenase AlkB
MKDPNITMTAEALIRELNPTSLDAWEWLKCRGIFVNVRDALERMVTQVVALDDREKLITIMRDRLEGRRFRTPWETWLRDEGAVQRCGAWLLDSLDNSVSYEPFEGAREMLRGEFREELLSLPWLTQRTARHECFMSLIPRTYTYGNKGTGDQTYTSIPFTERVEHCMEWMNQRMGTEFNVCFLNKYDDQHQHLGWHADDFPGMDVTQPIGVVSFGAAREIWVKDKRGFVCTSCRNGYTSGIDSATWCDACNNEGFTKKPPGGKQPPEQRFLLKEGSLFLMPEGYQDTHLHRIPKHDRECGWRISLTFRSFKGGQA